MNQHTDYTPVALYARVSSDRQDVDLSISAQLRALRVLAHHRLGIVALHVPLPGLHDAAVRVGGISLRLFGRKWLYHLGLSPPLLFACGLFFCLPLLHVLLDSLGCCFSLPLQTFLGFLQALEALPPSPSPFR